MPYLINGHKYYDRDEVGRLAGFHNGATLSATLSQIPKRNYPTRHPFPAHVLNINTRKFWSVEQKEGILAWKKWYEGVRHPNDGSRHLGFVNGVKVEYVEE